MTTQRPGFPVLLIALAACIAVEAASGQSVTEFRVLSAGAPLNIAPGPGGMWFTEENANRIGLVADEGRFSEFPVNRPAQAIVAGPDGNLWFTSSRFLSRMTPGGVVTDFPISGRGWGITVGPDHDIWFTELQINGSYGILGHATVAGQITEVLIGAWAESIASGPDGNFWLPDWTEVGNDAIVRVTSSGKETRYGLPGGLNTPGDVGPAAVAVGSDGNIWFTEVRTPQIGRVTPGGVVTVFNAPGAWGIAAGADGNLWFTDFNANKIGRLTTRGDYVELSVPTPNAQPWGIAAGPNQTIWFTEHGASRIGRISIGGAVSPCDANTLCLGGGRFHVTAAWQSPTASGLGQALSLTPDTGYFWFLDSSNVEVLVKVLDACSASGRKWVFAAGLTNVNVVLTVTDTQTGLSKTYVNPQGTAFLPIQDTDAFSTCP